MNRRETLSLLAGLAGWGCAQRPPQAAIPWRLLPIASDEPIPVFVARPPDEGAHTPQDVETVWDALRDWSEASGGLLVFQAAEERTARIRVYWRTAEVGRAGEMRTSARRGYRINDVLLGSIWQGLPASLVQEAAREPVLREAIVYRMALHETGHALGLIHTAGLDDAMYHGADPGTYFRRFAQRIREHDGVRPSGVSATDRDRLIQLYPRITVPALV